MALALSQGVAATVDGKLVGTVLATLYGEHCATINMVIVDEAMRGRGLGRRLMTAAIGLAAERELRLVATADGLPLYQKLGFVETGTVMQYQGVVANIAMPDDIVAANSSDFEAICALDQTAFGAGREALFDYIAKVGQFAVIREHGEVKGFAALRAFGRGEVIGPVVASSTADAQKLVSYFLAGRPGRFLRVDTTIDTGLGDWLATAGLEHVGGGVAMRRPSPAGAEASGTHFQTKTFALASQALG